MVEVEEGIVSVMKWFRSRSLDSSYFRMEKEGLDTEEGDLCKDGSLLEPSG